MEKNKELLKKGTILNLVASFLCLISSLFLIVPVYYITVIVLSLTNDIGSNSTKTTISILSLIIFTLLKTVFSIINIILSFKAKKSIKFTNQVYFNKAKQPLLIGIMSLVLLLTILSSLICGFIIKYVIILDIIIMLLLLTSSIIMFINYSKRKNITKDSMQPE